MKPLPVPVVKPDSTLLPKQIAWATEAMAARLGVSCVPKALAARRLMHSAGYASRLRIGVINQPAFEAHAWLEHEGAILVGGDTGLEFAQLYDVD